MEFIYLIRSSRAGSFIESRKEKQVNLRIFLRYFVILFFQVFFEPRQSKETTIKKSGGFVHL